MPITAKSIIQRVIDVLNDDDNVRWKIPEIVRYFNDGQRDIATLRPDATNVRNTHPLVAGHKQNLPANGAKLIDINANGNKNAVTLVSSALLDAHNRNWRNMPGTNDILHYTYDPREPETFEVYPPALSTATLEIEFSSVPTDIAEPAAGATVAAVTGDFALSDLFANAQQNYILYRCYSKDTELTANPARAQAFYQAYANDLGVELKMTVGVGPTQKKQASAAQAMQGA